MGLHNGPNQPPIDFPKASTERQKENSRAQLKVAQIREENSPLILQVAKESDEKEIENNAGSAQHTEVSFSPQIQNDLLIMAEKEIQTGVPYTPAHTAQVGKKSKKSKKSKKGKGKKKMLLLNPIRRSARIKAKGSTEQGYFRAMDKGVHRPRAKEKDRLKIDFEAKKDDINQQLAMSIVTGTGLKGTDQVRAAFEEAAIKDATETEKDLQAQTGHVGHV